VTAPVTENIVSVELRRLRAGRTRAAARRGFARTRQSRSMSGITEPGFDLEQQTPAATPGSARRWPTPRDGLRWRPIQPANSRSTVVPLRSKLAAGGIESKFDDRRFGWFDRLSGAGLSQTTKVLAQGHVYDNRTGNARPGLRRIIYRRDYETTDPKWGTTANHRQSAFAWRLRKRLHPGRKRRRHRNNPPSTMTLSRHVAWQRSSDYLCSRTSDPVNSPGAAP